MMKQSLYKCLTCNLLFCELISLSKNTAQQILVTSWYEYKNQDQSNSAAGGITAHHMLVNSLLEMQILTGVRTHKYNEILSSCARPESLTPVFKAW